MHRDKDGGTDLIMDKEEAKAMAVRGWNLRCNVCGSYGAEWIHGERPGWGALALCPKHKAELIAEKNRHAKEMNRLRSINFEQDWAMAIIKQSEDELS